MVTALAPSGRPMSAAVFGQPMRLSTSSFSASATRQVLPNVPLSVSVRKEACDIAQIEPPEASDGGVGLEAVAQRALLVVEVQRLGDRAVDGNQRLRPRRVAGVLDAVFGVRHRFGQRHQHRHVFRPAAGHDAIRRRHSRPSRPGCRAESCRVRNPPGRSEKARKRSIFSTEGGTTGRPSDQRFS